MKLKVEIKWAFIFFAVSLAWILLEKAFGLHDSLIEKHNLYSKGFVVLAIGVYVLAILEKRNTFYQGSMSWKEGFRSGLILSLGIAILTPATLFLMHKVISPDFIPNIIELATSKAMTEEQATKVFSLQRIIMEGVKGTLMTGLATSAGVSFFIKTRK